MGGDYAPDNVVAGAIEALKESSQRISIVLVGQQERISAELKKPVNQLSGQGKDSFSIANATEVIEMHDSPTAVLKTKRNSSIVVGLNIHKERKVDAFVSAGNTGAVMSASTLILGRIAGVGRPTIGVMVPTAKDPCLLLDAGANVDCRARHLFEFGVMGSIYVGAMLGRSSPRVGLLSIGEEESKGNEITLEALDLFKKSKLNFVGNVEGRDILRGDTDVIVCDGFVGNILLKFGESVPEFFKAKFKRFAEGGILNKLSILIARKGMRSVMRELDYQEHGGVPLLGVNGVSIIGHGRSTPKAIKNMIYRAEEVVRRQVNTLIQNTMAQYGQA
ncbi:MAG: Phosphate acyltransferase [Bacteroidetes bacterium]|nr:Phosphate acyltransferase [Bacteroidota bacterium]